MSLYRIHVQPDGDKFRLCNHGETCGPRLVKREPFPFTVPRWWILETREQADTAAARLQTYLDNFEEGAP